MLKSGLVLASGNIFVALLNLARNVLIARMISVEDFGIASTFAITMALVEMSSNLAVDRLIVQAKDGDAPLLQSTLQTLQFTRGVVGAIIFFILADPLAALFGIPDVTWAYQLLAIIPLLRGLSHLDMFRVQRDMQFLPSIKVELTAQALSTAFAVVLAYLLKDYRAMLYALLIQQLVFTVMSHAVASQVYCWAWNPMIARRAATFGWPILLNGLLMFCIFQGDRILVGSLIGMEELGWFSAAFGLTLIPMLIVSKTLHSFFLPLLAKAQDDRNRFWKLSIVTIQAAILISVINVTIFAILGPTVLIVLFGVKYQPAIPILVWLAVMQAFRIVKVGPAIIALAKAESKNALIANLARLSVLPLAWICVAWGAGINGIIGVGIAGEFLGLTVALLFVMRTSDFRRPDVQFRVLLIPLTAGSTVLVIASLDAYIWTNEGSSAWNFHWAQVLLLAATLSVFWSTIELRGWLRRL